VEKHNNPALPEMHLGAQLTGSGGIAKAVVFTEKAEGVLLSPSRLASAKTF